MKRKFFLISCALFLLVLHVQTAVAETTTNIDESTSTEASTNDEDSTSTEESTNDEDSTSTEASINNEESTSTEASLNNEASTSTEATITTEASTNDEDSTSTEASTNDEDFTSTEASINNEASTSTEASINNEASTSTEATITTAGTEASTTDEDSTSTEASTNDEDFTSTEAYINNEASTTVAETTTSTDESTSTEESTNDEDSTSTEPSTNNEESTSTEASINNEASTSTEATITTEASTNDEESTSTATSTNNEASTSTETSTNNEASTSTEATITTETSTNAEASTSTEATITTETSTNAEAFTSTEASTSTEISTNNEASTSNEAPTTAAESTSTAAPTTTGSETFTSTEASIVTAAPTTTAESTNTDAPTTTAESTNSAAPTTTAESTNTGASTTTAESTNTAAPTTTAESTNTDAPTTTAESTNTAAPTSTAESTNTAASSTTAESTNTAAPTTTAESTNTAASSTTAESTNTAASSTTAESTNTAAPTTTAESTSPAAPTTTAESSTTAVPTTTAAPTTSTAPTTTATPGTTTPNLCDSVTCQNGGKCLVKNGIAGCRCNASYSGQFCQFAVPYYTQWSAWGDCDSSCGDGLQTKTRNCTDITGANRGQDCGANLEAEKACPGLPKCVVTTNPCDAPVNPCLSDGVSHTCRLQAGGAFKCNCKDGFINRGKYCVNENECNRVNNDCKDVNTKTWKQGVSNCSDTVGSYDCVCASGFTYNSTSRVCTDVDECSTGASNCDDPSRATCRNTPGGFSCSCVSGYTGDGTTGKCKENRLLSFAGHSKLGSSDKYSTYFQPNFAVQVGNYLYPSFYFTRGGLLLFTTVTSDTVNSGVRRSFTNPSKFSLNPNFQEKAAFAPWWSNMITGTDAASGVYYKEFSSDVSGENLLIQGQKGDFSTNYPGFSMPSPKYMIIITWNKMELSKNTRANAETVTFQLVMITDYENTYVKVIYSDREMKWDVLNSVGKYPVRIGVLKQNETAAEYPQSYLDLTANPQDKNKIEKIDEVIPTGLSANVAWKRKGFSYYKISGGAVSHPGLVCSKFLSDMRATLSNASFSVKTNEVSQCPPSLFQKTDSLVTFKAANIPSTITCFAKRNALSGSASDERTPRCCYDNNNNGLITEASIASGYNTYMIRKPNSRIQQTIDSSYGICCKAEYGFASKSDLCSEFLGVFPVCSSENFVASGAGGALGDPHLASLDGLSYTFNGHGEFVLLKASDVEVQGRFSPQLNTDGVKSATFISAIAGQQSSPSSDKVEFRLTSGGNTTEILRNGVVDDVDLSSGPADWKEVSVTKETNGNGISTWKMIFSGGLTAGVQLTNGMFQLVVSASSSYRSQFEGLLGNFDGNVTNDFKKPDGTYTPSDSVESVIYDFGKLWQNNENSTLFTYGGSASNANWASHVDDGYTPAFFNADLTVMFPDPAKRTTAISTCNSGKSTDSNPEKRKECYFDFKVTENAAVASSTSSTKAELAETQSALANYPPEITNGNVTIEVSVGGNFNLVLNAKDQNEGDTIFFLLNSDAPSGVSVNNATKTLTWVGVPDSNSMSIKVTVSDGKAQSLWTPKIKLCKCKNGAKCEFGVESSEQFFIVPCTCVEGYDGTYCENDKDGCASGPCWPGVDCTDVLAKDLGVNPQGFTCGSCPSHLDGDGISCSDKDECVVNKPRPCQQICTNIANGYTCSCNSGYVLGSDLDSCIDNDECQLKTDNCDKATTTCSNTVGSFTCNCKTGYSRETASKCADINECNNNPCPANSRCQNTVGSYTCTCNYGYQLNVQTNQCEDKDECAGSNNCQQKCIDGFGTYTCGCNTGYKLNETDLVSCLPENECSPSQKATCDGGNPRTSCAVVNGDVLCTCPSGFALDAAKNCIDIDECATNVDICVDTKSDCINSEGGYRCRCKPGYINQGDFACADVNECTSGHNCTSPATCSNTVGSYTCVCPSGYTKSGQYGCSDIDECASAATHGCDKEYGACSNTPGGYDCSCNKGFTGTGYVCADLNECATTNNCTQKCSNAIGGYTCSCFGGYTLDGDGFTCSDVNECTDSAANGCYSNSYCSNTKGSYTCSCPADYRLKGDGKTCESIYKCADNHGCSHTCGKINFVDTCSCPNGLELDSTNKTCVDTNECASSSTNLCKAQNFVVCANTNGSYVCNCVNNSYVKSQESVCIDANECILKTANCPANSVCVNQNPGYDCRCLTGYQKVGSLCQDINECSGSNDCHPTLATCRNSPGGYSCSCKAGYAGDGRTCTDINECVLNTHNCDSRTDRRTCTNTPGSFTCGCVSGYQLAGDGRTCNDVDECAGSGHGCSQICKNIDGGFECKCQLGYRLNADQKTCTVEAECGAVKKATCLKQQCAKINGTDTCQCPQGYALGSDGTSCNDVNECLASPCYVNNSRCENTVGGYNCSCTNGYILGPNNVCKDRNGGLSLWGAWGSCSKTCGGGVRTRTRSCDNPTKEGFGADCVGELTMVQVCNTQLCPPNEVEKNYGILLQFNGLPVSYFTTRVQGEFRTTVANGINNYCNTNNANLRKCCNSNSTYVPNTSSLKRFTNFGQIAIGDGFPRERQGLTQIMLVVKSDKSNALCSASKKRRKRGISLGGNEAAIPQSILAEIMQDPAISQAVVSNIVSTVKSESNVTLTVTSAPIVLVTNNTNEVLTTTTVSTQPTTITTAGGGGVVVTKEGSEGWVAAVAAIFSVIGVIVILLLLFILLSRKNMIPGLPGSGKKSKEEDEEIKMEKSGKASASDESKKEETKEDGEQPEDKKEEEEDKNKEQDEDEEKKEGEEDEKEEKEGDKEEEVETEEKDQKEEEESGQSSDVKADETEGEKDEEQED